jgi:hypothetical protein
MCVVAPEKDPGCVFINVYISKLLSISNASARLTGYLKHLWWQNNSLKSFLDYKLCSQLPCFASSPPSRLLTLTVQIWSGQETAFYGIWRFSNHFTRYCHWAVVACKYPAIFLSALKRAVLGAVKMEKFWHPLGNYAKQWFITVKWNVLCAKGVYEY